jgi:hypothetical protein
MITKPEYQIKVETTRKSCFDYKVNFADGRTGNAQLSFFPIDIFDYTKFYDHLLGKGLKPYSLLSFVINFYPNGDLDYKNEEDVLLMRHGAGSAVWELMVKDSVGKADVMYCSTAYLAMARFLGKKGCTAYDDQMFYKLLPS